MAQIVFTAADLPTLVTASEAMGFYSSTLGIIQDGVIPNGGSWFYNFVGPVVQTPAVYNNGTFPPTLVTAAVMAPGLWGRLIHNGDPSYIPALPVNSGVTLYEYSATLGGWSSDGVTLAPDYVGTIGLVM
jgi:hypothetical protein